MTGGGSSAAEPEAVSGSLTGTAAAPGADDIPQQSLAASVQQVQSVGALRQAHAEAFCANMSAQRTTTAKIQRTFICIGYSSHHPVAGSSERGKCAANRGVIRSDTDPGQRAPSRGSGSVTLPVCKAGPR